MSTAVAERDLIWVTNALRAVVENVLLAQPTKKSGSNDEEAAQLAEALGLNKQRERFIKLHNGEIGTVFQSVRLDGEELACWELYCPTHYVEGTKAFSNYSFDTVPVEVLKYWTELKEKYSFDRFEIWTTERPKRAILPDPLLIGMYEGSRYLLARWGKEAADLIPFSEVLLRTLAMRCFDFDIASVPKVVAKNLTDVLRKSSTVRIQREDDELWSKSFLFPIKHCSRTVMAFKFWSGTGQLNSNHVYGICAVCGDTRKLSADIR